MEDEAKLNEIKAQICHLPVQQFEGVKRRSIDSTSCPELPSKKFHFDHVTGKCVLVEFSGCFGTDNLFDEEDKCLKFCNPPINFDDEKLTNETSKIKVPRKGTVISCVHLKISFDIFIQ